MSSDSLNSCFMPISRLCLDWKAWVFLIQVFLTQISQLGSKNKGSSNKCGTETNQMNRSWLASSNPHSSGVILSCLLLTKHSMLTMLIIGLLIRNITYHCITMDIQFPGFKTTQIQHVLYLKGVVLIWTWWFNNTYFQESAWKRSCTRGFRNQCFAGVKGTFGNQWWNSGLRELSIPKRKLDYAEVTPNTSQTHLNLIQWHCIPMQRTQTENNLNTKNKYGCPYISANKSFCRMMKFLRTYEKL